MLELGHLLLKFSRWTTSKQKTKSLQLITNTAPTCRQAWGIAKTRPTSGVKQLKRKKTSLSTSSSRPLPPSFPSVLFPRRRRLSTRSPNSDPTPAAAIGAQPVSRRASFFHHSSRCINGNTKLRQSCSSLARPRFWTDPNDVQTGGFLLEIVLEQRRSMSGCEEAVTEKVGSEIVTAEVGKSVRMGSSVFFKGLLLWRFVSNHHVKLYKKWRS
jgi:hypothetical protein